MHSHIGIRQFGLTTDRLSYDGLTIFLSKINFGQWTKNIVWRLTPPFIITGLKNKVFDINKLASVAYTSRVSTTEALVSLSASMTQYLSGKLGKVVLLMSRENGANLDDQIVLTSWRRHAVRAALCRLRHRGYVITAGKRDGRITYTLHQER